MSSGHGEELSKWNKQGQYPEGVLTEESERLLGIFSEHRSRLSTDYQAGAKCLVVPEVRLDWAQSPNGKNVSGYFFATTKDLKKKHPTISAYVDSDTSTEEAVSRLSIDTETGMATEIDTKADFTDRSLLSALINAADNELSKKAREKVLRRRRRVTRAAESALAVGIAAFSAGVTYEFMVIRPEAAARRAAKARQLFDKSGYKLPGVATSLAEASVTVIPAGQFDRIPTYTKGDDFHNARRFTIKGDRCREFDLAVNPGQAVYIGQSSGDKNQNDQIGTGLSNTNKLYVCSLNKAGAKPETLNLAVQIRNASK